MINEKTQTSVIEQECIGTFPSLRSFAFLVAVVLSLFAAVGLPLCAQETQTPALRTGVTARYLGAAEQEAASSNKRLAHPMGTTATGPTPPVLTFNPAAVGVAPGSAQTLTATFAVSGYSGSFTPTATLHFGLNYTIGTVTCTASGTGENCSVPIKFVPIYPGGRKDAIFLSDGTTRLATVLLGGVGQAPFAFTENESEVVSSTPFPGQYIYQSQTDEDGTWYVHVGNSLGVVTKDGVASMLPLAGNPYVYSFSLDGAGVLYIQSSFGNQMITYDTVQGIQGTYTLPSNDYWYPSAFSDSGSLFVLNQDTQLVWEFKPDGTTATTHVNPSVNQDYQMTVDAANDVFVSGYTINEITAAGKQTEVNTVGGLDGLAVDAAGTLYATRYSPTGGVAVLSPSDYSTPITALDTSSQPLGVSLGPDGTVNISNYTTLDVVDRSHSSTVIDFGNVGIGVTSSAQAGAIYNGGNQPLAISDFTLDDTDFSLDASQPNHCAPGIQVAAGAVCQILAKFTPAHAGKYAGTITVRSNSLNSSNAISTISVTGTSDGIYNVATPATLSFGSQNTGTTSAAKTETLTAEGYDESFQIQSLASSNPAFAVSAGTCTSSYAPGQSCQLNVTFSPNAAQSYSANITVVSVIPGASITTTTTFAVSGAGTQALTTATPVLTPASGTYSSNQSVTITDSTGGAKIYYTSDGSTPGAGSTLYSSPIAVSQNETTLKAIAIAAGDADSAVASATYTLQVATPTLTPPGGTYSGDQKVSLGSTSTGAQIYYTTDGSDPSNGALYSGPITIATTGTTLKAIGKLGGYENSAVASGTYTLQFPGTTLSASSLNFGNQTEGTTSSAQSSTLTNSGHAVLQITGISITGANPSDFAQTNNCGASLAAGASCAISVTFTPAAAATYSASVSIATDASGSPSLIALSGTGIVPPAPVVTLSPSSLSFGNQTTGTSSTAKTVTITNSGNATLSNISISLSETKPDAIKPAGLSSMATGIASANYAATTTCSSTLAAGANCTVSVTFSPTATGSLAGSLLIADNAGGSPQSVSLTGTGTAPPQGEFTVSTSPATATVKHGSATQFTVQVGTSGGPYNSAVTLTASGLPTGATASFTPTSVTPGSGTASSELTIQTSSSTASNGQSPLWPAAQLSLGLLFFTLPLRRRLQRSVRLLLVVLMLGLLGTTAALSGCGGNSRRPITSTVTVTATSGTDVHTTTIELTVD